MWLHLRGARHVIDPATGVDQPGDVWIRDGVIASVGAPPDPGPAPDASVEVIDATDCLIAPLFTDLHVHLREPGGEQAETVATGAASAWAGGFGRVYAMANTDPVCDTPSVVDHVRRAAADHPVEVVPVGALSVGLRGRTLAPFDDLASAGVGALSDDGAWLSDPALMREALRWSARNDVPVFQHCEDFGRTGPGVLHACACVHEAGLPGIPSDAEVTAIERDIALSAKEQAGLHVCHLSTLGGVEAIRRARERGERVTAEVTPHHLLLTAADAVAGGPDFKMKPPLRDPSDVDALIDALVDGTVDAIATDHAPHPRARKDRGLVEAPFGVVGLETAFPAVYSGLVRPGRLSLARLVALLTTGPAAVVGRAPDTIRPGAPARLVGIDLANARPVHRHRLRSRSTNTPFHGRVLRGWPVWAVTGRRVVHHPTGLAPPERNRTT